MNKLFDYLHYHSRRALVALVVLFSAAVLLALFGCARRVTRSSDTSETVIRSDSATLKHIDVLTHEADSVSQTSSSECETLLADSTHIEAQQTGVYAVVDSSIVISWPDGPTITKTWHADNGTSNINSAINARTHSSLISHTDERTETANEKDSGTTFTDTHSSAYEENESSNQEIKDVRHFPDIFKWMLLAVVAGGVAWVLKRFYSS